MELINNSTRKAIKKMVYVSQCARAVTLMPSPEDFAIRLVGDLRIIARMVNRISIRINELLERYSCIPNEFLIRASDELLNNLNGVEGYTNDAIGNILNGVSSNKVTRNLGNVYSITPAYLQIGGGLKYNNPTYDLRILVPAGSGKRVLDTTYTNTNGWTTGSNINDIKSVYDESLIETINKTQRQIELDIRKVKMSFDMLTKDFDNMFGFANDAYFEEDIQKTNHEKINDALSDSTEEIKREVDKFIKSFNVGKVVGAIGGLAAGAGLAAISMDLLPTIDSDMILREVMGGVDTYRVDIITSSHNNYKNNSNLLEVPDVNRKLSKDDIEKYNSKAYDAYIDSFSGENDKVRSNIFNQMQTVNTCVDLNAVNNESVNENKSALKSIQNVRENAVKAKQIEKYKRFLSIELDCLKRECLYMKDNIKYEWDLMMLQYKTSIEEITNFFTVMGNGGNETVDRCCDRINDDANQIVELCKSIAIEMVNASSMVGVPYAVGLCSDMPVHKVLAFVKDLQMILTFLKNLIRLGVDIITQLTILAKLIFGGIGSMATILNKLKSLIGVDKVLDMIDNLVGKSRPTMAEGKILMENALSPIYYNETPDYERRVEAIEGLLSDDVNGGYVEKFRYTDDVNARNKYRKKVFGGYVSEDDIEDILEELESKGEREIVAYRSPILNDTGDDFAGWIFYHADAYDDMKRNWSSGKKRKRNKVIKKASKKNKLRGGRLIGGVSELRKNKSFGYYNSNNTYIGNTVSGFDAYYWYTKYTNDPTDCDPDFDNTEYIYDDNGNIIAKNDKFKQSVVVPIQTTANGSLVELSDGRRVFVEGKIVKSGDFVNVDGVKYKVK